MQSTFFQRLFILPILFWVLFCSASTVRAGDAGSFGLGLKVSGAFPFEKVLFGDTVEIEAAVFPELRTSFSILNSNGLREAGEPFVDIGEPFLDRNGNGLRDPGEFFIDVNGNGSWSAGNGVWDPDTKIWTAGEIVFSDEPLTEMVGVLSLAHLCVFDLNGNSIMGGSSVKLTFGTPHTVRLAGETDTTATITLPDQFIPDPNPSTVEPAGSCIPFSVNRGDASAGPILVHVQVNWKVPGVDDLSIVQPYSVSP